MGWEAAIKKYRNRLEAEGERDAAFVAYLPRLRGRYPEVVKPLICHFNIPAVTPCGGVQHPASPGPGVHTPARC